MTNDKSRSPRSVISRSVAQSFSRTVTESEVRVFIHPSASAKATADKSVFILVFGPVGTH